MSLVVTPGYFSKRAAKQRAAYKSPTVMVVLSAVILLFFGVVGSDELVAFRVTAETAAFRVPDLIVSSRLLAFALGILGLVASLIAFVAVKSGKKVSRWLNVGFGALAVTALLAWVGAGGVVPVTFLLTGTLALSVPIILGGMSGVLSERVGVVNIAIEGQLLTGAFVAAVVATLTNNLLFGMVAAMFASALLSMVLAIFSIRYFVDQIIVGVVLNVLVIGITNFLFAQWLSKDELGSNFPGTLPFYKVPLLSDIPVLGPLLFDNRITVYLAFLIVPLLWFLLFRTKSGLRLRAVGEYPMAADTAGVDVAANRFWWVTLGGMIAGLGGAALSIGNVGGFVREMSAGQGFIALAAVILGRWHPFTVAAAALLFGFASIFRIWAGQANSAIPSDFIAMIPYVVTLIAVAGFVGKVRPPAAAGKAYVKE
jgi:general nucleoside transport system permease protein